MSYFDRNSHLQDNDINGLKTISPKHMSYVGFKFDDDPIMCKTLRKQYIRHVNKWLESPLYSNDIEKKEETELLKNQTVAKRFFDEIVEAIEREEFEIIDYKQFKEDVICFLYTLSELR